MTPIRFIIGSGRSGTTWVQDALAAANGLRSVFEPLHPYVSEVGARYAHKALAAGEEHPDLERFLVDVGAGRGPRLWTQYRQQLRWLLPPPSKFSTWQDAGRTWRYWGKFAREFPRMTLNGLRNDPLVKCIRANLMVPWIKRHLDSRVVFIVRHPGAVVESELRSSWNASFALDRFRRDKRLHELTHGRYLALLGRHLSPIQALAVRWVIENQWVLEAAAGNEFTVIHYEQLRSSDRGTWSLLCDALGLDNLPDIEFLIRPSQQSGSGRKAVPLELPKTPRWMGSLTLEQKTIVRRILDSVEFDRYSMDEAFPRNLGVSPHGANTASAAR
jgi:hypothetical protein